MKKSALFLLFVMACMACGATKVACVGDSITYGARVEHREWLSYPSQLQHMLGDAYEVRNFGVSGATLLKKGNRPYWKTGAYKDALAWNPDVVVIKLGTNDTKLDNWKHKAEFEADLSALVRSFQEQPGKPRVFLALPVPAFSTGERIDGTRVREGVLPAIRNVAKELDLPVIDFHSRMLEKKALLPDNVHPNAEGAFELAAEACEAISGNPFKGSFAEKKPGWVEGLPPVFSDWKGFRKYDFTVGGAGCSVVVPEKAAPGNPWIWRARFFGHEPQTDIALLERGYHVGYCDVANLFGSPEALSRWDSFYQFATGELGLSARPALEGMSRGGLIIFNWARANPDKVASIYADAPVCDFKSWPGGKGDGTGHPASWEKCMKAYGFKDEAAALAYKGNPVDHAGALKSIPTLFVYGKADDVVPPAENCEPFAEALRSAGGTVEMIGKEGGGHHPHSLTDPSPIVDFIVNARSRSFTIASPFGDHMVLQRDQPVPVWGTGTPGEKVTVEFAGQKKSAVVDSSNRWKITLDPMSASSESRTFHVSGLKFQASFTNVVIGEVWICSGQSNMQMGWGGIPDIKALAEKAENIRCLKVKNTVAFEEQDALEGAWAVDVPPSAVAFSFAHFLEEAAGVPVGIIQSAWGSSSIEAWMPRDMMNDFPHFKTIMDEFDADEPRLEKIRTALARPGGWSKQEDVYLRRQPNILYNAMMHPLAPYACRGLVWYQGERNTRYISGMPDEPFYKRVCGMREYGDVLTQWIERYRKEWGHERMHFLIVGMPGFGNSSLESGPKLAADDPSAQSWAWMRESQFQALELPATGVITAIDLGLEKNIHPKDKLPIGQRLALLAARDTLGLEIVAEGPVMKKVNVRGAETVVYFDQPLSTTDGEAPSAFWLADDSAQWKKADARINGNTVVLRSSEIRKPLYVRYAFAGKPSVNLVNKAGLPARPFRTDQFDP